MSNSQKQISELMHEWALKMQESMQDPRLSEVMVDYYKQYQNLVGEFQNAAKAHNAKQASDEDDVTVQVSKLTERVSQLEAKIRVLESVIIANQK